VQALRTIFDGYHEQPESHNYFVPLTTVLNMIRTSYKIIPQYNTAVHCDIFKWSTIKSWGRLPKEVQQELLSLTNIIEDIERLKPNVVILGIEDKKAEVVFPELKWQEILRFEKEVAIYTVRMGPIKNHTRQNIIYTKYSADISIQFLIKT